MMMISTGCLFLMAGAFFAGCSTGCAVSWRATVAVNRETNRNLESIVNALGAEINWEDEEE